MKIWKFEVKEGNDFHSYYRTNEAEASTFKALLDENGETYSMASFFSVHNLIKNMPEWEDSSVSDGEMLDKVLELIEGLGL